MSGNLNSVDIHRLYLPMTGTDYYLYTTVCIVSCTGAPLHYIALLVPHLTLLASHSLLTVFVAISVAESNACCLEHLDNHY